MNILFTYYFPSGGMETLARQRSEAMKKHGISFDFLYFHPGKGVQNITGNQTFITNKDDEINRLLKKGNYDLIIVCSDYPFIERLRKLGYSGKILFEVQGLGDFQTADQWLKDAVHYIEQNDVSGLLYPRTPHLMRLVDLYYPNHNHFCFDNCIDTSTFQYRKNNCPSQPILAWVGRIEENKNWSDYLTILATLRNRNPTIHGWMFEDSSMSSIKERLRFNKSVRTLQLTNSIKMFDNIPHASMADYYSMVGDSGGLLCSTSKVEGFGYAIIEAMSCRCPVLTTDSDGIKRSVVQNNTGKIYPHHDISKAVAEAEDLMYSSFIRKIIIEHAEQQVKDKFSLPLYANNFLSMIHSLK
ncbi:glycosyltransferase family 4 protein [Pseudalkalibacillus decolorationis]|uniref:glycosyltransferase family 4 protein n=1 Tax=Pseudalkalibacillus decolorationis TaxID=163879 RepID=UPI002148C925|nr:glycosyltransferase [Pseudalkalibacillus decolorationis]